MQPLAAPSDSIVLAGVLLVRVDHWRKDFDQHHGV